MSTRRQAMLVARLKVLVDKINEQLKLAKVGTDKNIAHLSRAEELVAHAEAIKEQLEKERK